MQTLDLEDIIEMPFRITKYILSHIVFLWRAQNTLVQCAHEIMTNEAILAACVLYESR